MSGLLGILDGIPYLPGALCAQTDPDVFHPDKGGNATTARALCHACPERVACLTWALDHNERHGVWGATTARERARIPREDLLIAAVVDAAPQWGTDDDKDDEEDAA